MMKKILQSAFISLVFTFFFAYGAVYSVCMYAFLYYTELAHKEGAQFNQTTGEYVQRFDNIEHVYMNEPNYYTFVIRDGAYLKAVDVENIHSNHWHERVDIIEDIPDGEPMYAILTINIPIAALEFGTSRWRLEIHVRESKKDK